MRARTRTQHTHTQAPPHVYLRVVDLGDEGERVPPGLPDVLDGQLDRRFDALADAAHRGRLVHGHENHDGQVLPVPGEPAVVLAVLGAVVAHLGQRGVEQQSGEEQERLPAAAVPPSWSHAAAETIPPPPPPPPPPPLPRAHCPGIANPGWSRTIRAHLRRGKKRGGGEEQGEGAAAPAVVHASCTGSDQKNNNTDTISPAGEVTPRRIFHALRKPRCGGRSAASRCPSSDRAPALHPTHLLTLSREVLRDARESGREPTEPWKKCGQKLITPDSSVLRSKSPAKR